MGRKNRVQRKGKDDRRRRYDNEVAQQEEKGYGALFNTYQLTKFRSRLDPYQQAYADAVGSKLVVGVDAGAGTGKTTISIMRGLELLKEGKVDKLHYVRFPDKVGQSLGALPGDQTEKEKGYMAPFYEACFDFGMQLEDIEALIAQGVFELSTDIFLRGRTMSRVFLIVDEAQNGTLEKLHKVLTRIKDNGYAVVIGHRGQVDNSLPKYGIKMWIPFEVYMYHMNKQAFTQLCELKHDYRGAISRWADKIGETLKELETA
jgi:phosphate starvation-inducible protein PhoH